MIQLTARCMVIRSTAGKTDWNAIDGNVIIEKGKKVWLSWGSFWGGLQIVRLDYKTGKLYNPDDPEIINIAARPRSDAHAQHLRRADRRS